MPQAYRYNGLDCCLCVISTKNAMKVNGMKLPAGSIVSVGGWSLANGTEGYSTKQLKDILYYNANPTREMRRANPRNLWLNHLFGDPATKRDNTKNLKFIVDHIRARFEANNEPLPRLWQDPTDPKKTMAVPTFMKLFRVTYDNTEKKWVRSRPIAYLMLNTPVFRTYLTRVAELFFNVYIAPLAAVEIQASTPAIAALKRVVKNLGNPFKLDIDPNTGKVTATRRNGDYKNFKEYTDEFAIQALNDFNGNLAPRFYNGDWYKTYYHSDFLGALFRDSVFKQWYPKAVQAIFDKLSTPKSLPAGLYDMMHTIMFYAMNADLPALVDSVNDQTHQGIDELNAASYNAYVQQFRPRVDFCTRAEIEWIVDHPQQVINVTNKNWRTDVIPRFKVTQRGYSYVVAGIDMERYNTLAWADKKYYQPAAQAAAAAHA